MIVAALLASTLTAQAIAQGLGASQAVRGRALGIAPSPETPPETPPPMPEPPPTPETPSASDPSYASHGAVPGKLDTTYVSQNAIALVVIRPAQFVTAPVAQLLPIDAIKAAAQKQIGADLADIDEIVMFGELANPMSPGYGMTFKFNKPFRATSIPEGLRVGTTLSDFNGKKYLQGNGPGTHSFYGPNNKTLIVAPDAVLRQVVQSSAGPKSGPLLERVRDVPSGSDLYVFVDLTTIGQMLPMLAAMGGQAIPPQATTALTKVSSVELTLNLVTRGPVAFVLHCKDEAAAQEIEAMMNAASAAASSSPSPSPEAAPGPLAGLADIKTLFNERLKQKFQPQRNGSDIGFRIEADDPLQPQLFGILLGMAMAQESTPATGEMPMLPGEVPPSGETPPDAVPQSDNPQPASRGENLKGLPGGVILEN